MDSTDLDYDTLLLRIRRAQLLLMALTEEAHTPSYEFAIRELYDDDGFLPLFAYMRASRN